jgi:glycine reductase
LTTRNSESNSLTIASFDCHRIQRAETLSLEDGVLFLNPDALGTLVEHEPAIRGTQIHLVQPGDPVRIMNVLDVVEPAVKRPRATATFPGTLGDIARAGTGLTHRVAGVAVISVADYGSTRTATHLKDLPLSIIDMAGDAAPLSPFASRSAVVVSFSLEQGASVEACSRGVRRTTLRVARAIAKATEQLEPDSIEEIANGPRSMDPALPSVCVITQIGSEGPLYDTYLYGSAVRRIDPIPISVSELLDGALVNDAFNWASVRNTTYSYQRYPLALDLLAEHGRRVNFVGVVLGISYLESAFEKERAALLAAKTAAELGADAAVILPFFSGSSHSDAMLTCRACERLGIRTTLIVAETDSGLFDHVPEADCIVSAGNLDEYAPSPGVDLTLLAPSENPECPERLRVASYLGATSQAGENTLTASSS